MKDSNAIMPASIHRDFESIKKTGEDGFEYWEARELMPLMDYAEWRKFLGSIQRAMISCHSSGQEIDYHFVGADKMIILAKNTKK